MLVRFLGGLPGLRALGPMRFEAAPGAPWVNLLLVRASPSGDYASDGASHPTFNLVEMVCSDAGPRDWYDSLAVQIARFLGWTATEDAEERSIWPA